MQKAEKLFQENFDRIAKEARIRAMQVKRRHSRLDASEVEQNLMLYVWYRLKKYNYKLSAPETYILNVFKNAEHEYIAKGIIESKVMNNMKPNPSIKIEEMPESFEIADMRINYEQALENKIVIDKVKKEVEQRGGIHLQIFNMLITGEKQKDIAKSIGVTSSYITAIKNDIRRMAAQV